MTRSAMVFCLVALGLILSPITASADDDYLLSVSTASAHPGSIIDIFAEVNADVGTVGGFDFTITYNAAVLSLSDSDVSAGSLLGSGGYIICDDSSGIGDNNMPPGVFSVSGANYQSSAAPGAILEMQFHVSNSASPGSYAITLFPGPDGIPGAPPGDYTPDLFNNTNFPLTPLTLENGSITVVPEPSSIALLAGLAGFASLVFFAKRRVPERVNRD